MKTGLDDYLAAGHSVEELLSLASPELRDLPVAEEPKALAKTYQATPQGLVWLKPTRDGAVPTSLTNFTARIIADVAEDDGAEVRRLLEIEAAMNGHPARFRVAASHFAGMNWPMEHLGSRAIVLPGFGLKDHARAAIQVLSGEVPERRVYTHAGWRKVGDIWVYLHAAGAIGPNGPIPGIEVSLPGALARYALPEPPKGAEQVRAIQASLGTVERLVPDRISMPVYAAIARAVIGGADFSLHLWGPTSAGKTELSALLQQHWGPEMDARHLPGAWSSTGNALEVLAFQLKDAVLVVDDFAPTGNHTDVQRLHREADRLLRAQGNLAGRQRLTSDALLRPSRPPRGLLVSTGEDLPRGQSLRARMLALEMGPNDMNWDLLTACQADAAQGLYAQALAGFVRWLAPQYEEVRRAWKLEIETLRRAATVSRAHRRTPEIVANLTLAFRYWLRFGLEVDAITEAQADDLWRRAWKALGEAASAQTAQQQAADPAGRFMELVSAALASGRAHVAAPDGSPPATPEAWGWRPLTIGTGEHQRQEWRPEGERIGWIEGDNLYLEPEASFGVAQRLARDGGDALVVGSKTLRKRLHEAKLLASSDKKRGKLTVRRTLEGGRRDVLHLWAASLLPQESAQSDQQPSEGPDDGPVPGADSESLSDESAQEIGPPEPDLSAAGPTGPISPQAISERVHAPGDVRPDPCHACKGTRFWLSVNGVQVCATCHPPPFPELVAVWLPADGSDGLPRNAEQATGRPEAGNPAC